MCKPEVDGSSLVYQQQQAAQARAAEEARAAAIRQGEAAVNEQFGRFDDTFYAKRGEDYLGYYQPQLDEQYQDALANLTFALSRAGTTGSSIAGDAMGDLQKRRERELAALASSSSADTSSLQARIAAEKSNLISQLNATGNAEAASNQALTRSQQLYSETPQRVPLGDLFSGLGSSIGAYQTGFNGGSQLSAFQSTTANPRRVAATTVG